MLGIRRLTSCRFRIVDELRFNSSAASQSPPPKSVEDARSYHASAVRVPSTSVSSPRTAENVVTSEDLLRDTLSDLYGVDGTVGIAKWERFRVLNDYLHGFRLGEVTILTGPTGCGKTTFLSEYSLDLAEQGVKTLWCNFELKNSRLCAMMVRQLYSTFTTALDPQALEKEALAQMVEDMSVRLPLYFTKFTGATKVENVLQAIQAQHDLCKIQHVIIDNLQFMLGTASLSSQNPFFVQDAVFSQFRRLATALNIHVTMVIHPRKFSQADDDQELSVHSLYGGAKASQEADNILLIQTRRNDQEFFTKYLQIAKNRYFGDTYMGNRLLLKFHKASKRHQLYWKPSEIAPFGNGHGQKRR